MQAAGEIGLTKPLNGDHGKDNQPPPAASVASATETSAEGANGKPGHGAVGGDQGIGGRDNARLFLDSALERKLQEWVDAVKLHERNRLKRIADFAKAVLQIMVLALVVVFVLAAGVNIVEDYLHDRVLIDAIAVPKALEDRGYTSQAVTERLRDSVESVVEKIRSVKEHPLRPQVLFPKT